MLFCRLLFFFNINFLKKILSGIPSECQTDWIQIRPDKRSGLIWVQSVCKGYEQTALVGRVNQGSSYGGDLGDCCGLCRYTHSLPLGIFHVFLSSADFYQY